MTGRVLLASSAVCVLLTVVFCAQTGGFVGGSSAAIAPVASLTSEGEIVAALGVPGEVVPLGTVYSNHETGEIGHLDKYLYTYHRKTQSTLLGHLWVRERFIAYCYFIQEGKVRGGGAVEFGQSQAFLRAPSWVRLAFAECGILLLAAAFFAKERRVGRVIGALLATAFSVLAIGVVPLSGVFVLPGALVVWNDALTDTTVTPS